MTARCVRAAAILCLSAVLCLVWQSASTAADGGISRSFEMTVESQVDMSVGPATQKLVGTTVVRYTLVRRGPEVTVVFDEVRIKVTNNGTEMMNTTMNAAKAVFSKDGKLDEVRAADAPEGLKQMLSGSFGTPLCKLTLGEDGGEIKRTIVAGPGAKLLVDNGLIAGARLFHVKFPATERQWNAPNEVSMGNGGFARGTLTYAKTGTSASGQTVVKVSGTLVNNLFQPPGKSPAVKNARYVVTGKQTYDSAAGEWTSGDLSIDLSFDLEMDGKLASSAKGVMRVSLRSPPEKKSP